MKRGVLIIAGLAVVLVAVFTIVTLVNRGDNTPQQQKLTVYLPFDEEKVYQQLSSQFITDHPNAEITFEYIEAKDAKEYEAKVVNEIADGAGPDIWLVRSDWIPKHAAKSLPFEATAEQSDPIASAKTVIEPALVDLNVFKEKLYGIPLFADSLAVIYNLDFYSDATDGLADSDKKTLEKFPATWNLVKEQSRLVSRKSGGVITRSAIALGTVETMYAPTDVLSAILAQNGATILDEDFSRVTFDLAQFKDGKSVFPATTALDLFTGFARSSKDNYSWNNDLGNAVAAFKAGKTGAVIGYHSLLQDLIEEDLEFRINVAPLPQLDTKSDRVDYGVSWSHIVNNQTANPTLAKDFLAYLAQDKVQTEYSEVTGKLAVTPIELTMSKRTVSADSATDIYRAQLKTLQQLVKPEWQTVDEALQDAIKLVINSKQTPQSAVNSIGKRLEDLVE